jgi:hypothetical protein
VRYEASRTAPPRCKKVLRTSFHSAAPASNRMRTSYFHCDFVGSSCDWKRLSSPRYTVGTPSPSTHGFRGGDEYATAPTHCYQAANERRYHQMAGPRNTSSTEGAPFLGIMPPTTGISAAITPWHQARGLPFLGRAPTWLNPTPDLRKLFGPGPKQEAVSGLPTLARGPVFD